MPKFKLTFDSATNDNKALAAQIRALAATPSLTNNNNDAVKELLRKLYSSICDLGAYRGSPSAPDHKIIAAWLSFLPPIAALANALASLHGPLLAARTLLYLTHAFLSSDQLPQNLPATAASLKPVALRCHLLIAFDDALLQYLKALWTTSRGRETFAWVFTDYPVSRIHRCENCCPDELKEDPTNPAGAPSVDWAVWSAQKDEQRFKAACLPSPEELTPANGVHPVRVWRRPEGDTTHHPQDPDATSWQYSPADADADADNPPPRLLMYQRIGSEGPIREDYGYHIVDQDTGEKSWRRRPALRRSRQFILDTQKVRVLRERRALATVALRRGKMPAELVSQVWKYAEPVPEEPYLDKLDLCLVYQPFPNLGASSSNSSSSSSSTSNSSGARRTDVKCDECAKTYSSNTLADKAARRTCPLKSTFVWNLPLRTFHTLHETSTAASNEWRLCRYIPCTGHHHTGNDQDWTLPSRNLEAHLVQILRAQSCTADMTLQTAGLGPHDPVELPTEQQDNARKRRLWDRDYSDPKQQDAVDEAEWVGIDGLLGVMRHDRTLLGKHPSGSTTTQPSWMFGRTRQDEARLRSAFRHE